MSLTNSNTKVSRNGTKFLTAGVNPGASFRIDVRLAKAMGNWEGRYDLDMQTIRGESAYEIAKRLGKTSAATESAWVDEQKAGSELVALKALVDPILVHNSGAHNALCREKSLEVFSDA